MTLRPRPLLAAAAALILLSNAVVLTGVAYNRSGPPESRLALSLRELSPPWSWDGSPENSGLALSLRWRVTERNSEIYSPYSGNQGGRPAWLDDQRLAALGFDVARARGSDRRSDKFRDLDERQVLVVLELAGPDWEQAKARAQANLERRSELLQAKPEAKELQEARKRAAEYLAAEEQQHSRLFAVDVGMDLAELRARYPERERYLILPGKLRLLGFQQGAYLGPLNLQQLHVPHDLRSAFGNRPVPVAAVNQGRPPLTITVAVGRRLEPWVESVTQTR